MPQRLHRSVCRPLDRPQSRAETVSALMVRAVDGEALSVEPSEQGIVRVCFMQAVSAVELAVPTNMAVQRSAERNVDDLQSAADAENRLLLRGETAHECEFIRIAGRIDPHSAVRGFSVQRRQNVAAARKQQRIGRIGCFGCRKADVTDRRKIVGKRFG